VSSLRSVPRLYLVMARDAIRVVAVVAELSSELGETQLVTQLL
jgi:hypothetical protein